MRRLIMFEIVMSLVAVALAVGTVWGVWVIFYDPLFSEPLHEEVSPEHARFMLECTHDWMLSADECRAILQGEDPPPPREGC